MIILEGPDGAGKTRLIGDLTYALGINRAPRASDSITGPVPNVWDWGVVDVASWNTRPTEIYDRHPFISEPIYGPLLRDYLDPQFTNPQNDKAWEYFRKESLIVMCLPPYRTVSDNIAASWNGQMTGVQQHRRELYNAYQSWTENHAGKDYSVVIYDYTQEVDTSYALGTLIMACRDHMKRRGK